MRDDFMSDGEASALDHCVALRAERDQLAAK